MRDGLRRRRLQLSQTVRRTGERARGASHNLTVSIDLCTGYQRFTLGRPPKGDLGAPEPGESYRRAIELRPGGLVVFGPYLVPHGMTVSLHASGPIRAALAFEALVVRSLAAQTAPFDWQRPPRESARSTGGPAIRCARKTTLSSTSDDSGARSAAARRR